MTTILPISMRDTARLCTLKIKCVHVKRTKARLWLFGIIMKLAVVVCPMSVTVEDVS